MADSFLPSAPAGQASALGAFSAESSDLLPVYLLRFERENTRRSYLSDLTQFFGSDTVTLEQAKRISFVVVNQWISVLEETARPSTVQRKIAALRGFYSWLIALGALTTNPADRQLIRRGRRSAAGERVLTVLTRDQARSLIAAVDPDAPTAARDRALLLTLLHGVLRRSEARAMDFEHLRASGQYWVLELPRTKGGADQYVKLPAHVVEAIEEVRSVYGFRSGAVWRSLSNNGYGRRLSGQSIYSIASNHALRAGLLETVGAHTLRHTGCTLAIEGGATLQQVQAHARHKQLQTTMVYVHQRDRLKDNASDYINL